MLTENWLCGHNLPDTDSSALKGEAARYALITYLIHPEQVPEHVVVCLAESVFKEMVVEE